MISLSAPESARWRVLRLIFGELRSAAGKLKGRAAAKNFGKRAIRAASKMLELTAP